MGLGIAEQQYCLRTHKSLETLCETTLGDSGIINLLEKVLKSLQIQGFAPLGFSQQYEDQLDIP